MLTILLTAALAGCITPGRGAAVPDELTAQAQPVIPNVRYWPTRDPDVLVRAAAASVEREKAWLASQGPGAHPEPITFLAVSGGAEEGAFGAGLLVGWSETGTRPEFRAVTGISTGALIAPFAFLGPRYDPVLEATYTEVSRRDIFRRRAITAAVLDDAMADTAPLAALIDRYVTPEVLDEIAAEYAKGRLLFVGTTDLDAREPVIWDMTAIAASRDPHALELFRKVMLASASIPGAFPPVMIDVTVDGRRYQEMHVDGGVAHQVFLYPSSFRLTPFVWAPDRPRTVYVIRNARLDPDWSRIDRRTLTIAGRSVGALIHSQGMGDLTQIYLLARRDGVDFKLAYIPPSFDVPKRTDFDTEYMRALFAYGHDLARTGDPWHDLPPDYPVSPSPAP
ncbi:patatin-like phospholipase family protein [Caulobacter sp. 17J65-9]|uniref:patatin-like phospholipase family protein n=1 Tax=Caulobacter sp. 17J65-9 TaxID=2709382 RepID=UPI001969E662|nr:patatin-like phospholipase family protein [Caulobacter sp. 17J65-9]